MSIFSIRRKGVDVLQNRYIYDGKGLQDQTIGGTPFGWYDYGARFYDAEGVRFMSIDPLAEKYCFQTPYAYAANNPVRFIDWMGMGPGDLFSSLRTAAKDWANTYNGLSIVLKIECGSTFYEVKNNGKSYFSYNIPNNGDAHTVIPNIIIPEGAKVVGDIHSHGNDDPDTPFIVTLDNQFSGIPDNGGNLKESDKGDIGTNNATGTTGFLATPNGSLQEYDPSTGRITTISVELPSDPQSSPRLNNIWPLTDVKISNNCQNPTVPNKIAPEPTRPIYHISNNKTN